MSIETVLVPVYVPIKSLLLYNRSTSTVCCFQVLGKVVILVKTCGVEEEDRDAVKAGLKDKLKMYVSNSLFIRG